MIMKRQAASHQRWSLSGLYTDRCRDTVSVSLTMTTMTVEQHLQVIVTVPRAKQVQMLSHTCPI